MKNKIIALLVLSTLVSCRKVIDIDLNSTSPKYVIEGGVNNINEPCQIKITQTKNFSEDNNFEGVSNALVTISDNAGNTEVLSYISHGVYQTTVMQGVSGRIYNLTVKIDNETFSSISQMPFQVNMDTLYSYNFIGFGDTLKMANAQYFDPAGINNYYRFILTLNQDVKGNIILSDDELNNGKLATQFISYRNGDEGIKTGDSVRVEMQCIDKDVHNFFTTLNQTISQSSAAPTNPISNISGGALGYFSAFTVQRKAIKIQ